MLSTVILLLLCLLTAVAGVPLILRLIPPNDHYGVVTERARSRAELWYEVNRFAGWAAVAVAAIMVLALLIWSGTLLRPFWRQLATFIVLLGIGVGASLWYEREVTVFGRRWLPTGKPKSARRRPREVQPSGHAKR